MPIQVQRRSSEHSSHSPAQHDHHPHHHDPTGRFHVTSKAQQQHKEALQLALGSILTAKRPPMSPNSRPTSGTASPAYPFVHTPGTSTPTGTPPILYSTALGPMSSEYLHPNGHHSHSHGHHGHPLPPSRLGRTTPGLHSPIEIESATPGSEQQSPTLPQSPHTETLVPLSFVPELNPPLPPLAPATELGSSSRPVRPPIKPLHPSNGVSSREGVEGMLSSPSDIPCVKGYDAQGRPVQQKAKFLQTLQSKSAWDALIHGSFS